MAWFDPGVPGPQDAFGEQPRFLSHPEGVGVVENYGDSENYGDRKLRGQYIVFTQVPLEFQGQGILEY